MNDFTKFFQQPNENLKEEHRKQSEGMKKFLDQIPRAKPWPPDCNKCKECERLKQERDEARREIITLKFGSDERSERQIASERGWEGCLEK